MKRQLTAQARAKIAYACKRRKASTPARLFVANSEAWWNKRAVHPREIHYAIQQGYEAGWKAAMLAAGGEEGS